MAGMTDPDRIWTEAAGRLRSEIGEGPFSSYIAPSAVRADGAGQLILVTPTAYARDWVRKNALRRMNELWLGLDGLSRRLDVRCRAEMGSVAPASQVAAGRAEGAAVIPLQPQSMAMPMATVPPVADGARAVRAAGLQERLTFDSFVEGQGNAFALAIARQAAAWADGHFNPIFFCGPYGYGKTHLLNAIAWEAQRLRPDAKVIHLERDPLFSSVPLWGFPADLAISGCSEIALPALVEVARRKLDGNPSAKAGFEERRKRARAEHDAMIKEREARIEAVRKEKPIHPLWLSRCLGEAMDEKTILICESVTSPLGEVIDLKRPGSFFNTPPAGHLGWGLGAAIGAKLGAPDCTVIAAEGDGAYMFSAPTASHFTAQKYGVPFLTVIYNNQAWNASIRSTLDLYPDGVAAKSRNFPGCDLSPSPRFDRIVEACGGYGERVEDPAELPEAIRRGLKVVRQEKRQALLDVICKSPI